MSSLKITTTVQAGSLESSDILITLTPGQNEDLIINIKSDVIKQFGSVIKNKIEQTLKTFGVTSVVCYADDKGAMDYVIEARVEAAVKKALDKEGDK